MGDHGPLYLPTFAAVTALALLVVFRAGQRVLAPEHTLRADVEGGNVARSLLQVGHVLGVVLIAGSVVAGVVKGERVRDDALWAAAFGLSGVGLLALTGRVGVRLLLRSRLPAEIERGNAAAGVAAGGHYVATAIVIARSFSGDGLGELGLSFFFFAAAQVTLHLFVALFRALTTYDDGEEVLQENLAAALSYAGATVSIALLVGRAAEGDFVGWGPSLRSYALTLASCLVLYPVRQLVVQGLLLGARPTLRGGRLDAGIAAERSVGMGALEGVSYLATALLLNRLQ
ncbi:MAG: DUF350 domain-containing protein [Polyangiaceae bacterium]|jgi:uncharacterized membrane protein YjfL (UPF0719 family)|nr:DUF350 domain-containing protein [Polyangiaceae bacterium]